jgi:hypothetical protein
MNVSRHILDTLQTKHKPITSQVVLAIYLEVRCLESKAANGRGRVTAR